MCTLELDLLAKLIHNERTNKGLCHFKDKVYSRQEEHHEEAYCMIGQGW